MQVTRPGDIAIAHSGIGKKGNGLINQPCGREVMRCARAIYFISQAFQVQGCFSEMVRHANIACIKSAPLDHMCFNHMSSRSYRCRQGQARSHGGLSNPKNQNSPPKFYFYYIVFRSVHIGMLVLCLWYLGLTPWNALRCEKRAPIFQKLSREGPPDTRPRLAPSQLRGGRLRRPQSQPLQKVPKPPKNFGPGYGPGQGPSPIGSTSQSFSRSAPLILQAHSQAARPQPARSVSVNRITVGHGLLQKMKKQ